MAENESIAEATSAPKVESVPAAAAEKTGLFGQTPSMLFLISCGVVFLISLLMNLLS